MMVDKIPCIELKYVFGSRSSKIMFDNSWELTKEITFMLSNGEVITIPKGFQTDFSSVPEFLWGIMKPFGEFLLAPIVHDYLYRNEYNLKKLGKYESRLFHDKEMLLISKKTNSKHWHNRLDNYARYYLVRAFGWINYAKTHKL
jgi:hypothetical protein